MTNSTTLNQIVIGVAKSIEPLQTNFTNDIAFVVFMKSLGWNVNSIPAPISSLNSSIDDTISKVNIIIAGNPTTEDYLTLINCVKSLTQSIYCTSSN